MAPEQKADDDQMVSQTCFILLHPNWRVRLWGEVKKNLSPHFQPSDNSGKNVKEEAEARDQVDDWSTRLPGLLSHGHPEELLRNNHTVRPKFH